ncbi:MAG: winged helix-turn-helix domain-containing protein [Calditrichaeota bacterium]|nr:winged helix-turn-helix domain-containing protein [Calditrichota bacterium]
MATKLKRHEYIGLRKRCIEMHEQGVINASIAVALGRAPSWVSNTIRKYREEGIVALEGKRAPGATPKISAEQVKELITELEKGPVAHGFNGELWTRKRINLVIERMFGKSYDESQVGRILKKAGWSRQKPQSKARQQRPGEVKRWKQESLPAIKKKHGKKDR